MMHGQPLKAVVGLFGDVMPERKTDAAGSRPVDRNDAERIALEAAVAEARSDPRAAIPHEQISREILENIAHAERRLADIRSRRKAS
jgi:hypothetical protein